MSAAEKPKKSKPPKGAKTPLPAAPPLLEDTPTLKMPVPSHFPPTGVPSEGEKQPVASDHGSTGGSMPKGKTARPATQRSDPGLGRQVFEGADGIATQEERIRERAYQIWETEGAGDPEEHWYRAERELKDASDDLDNPGQPKADLAAANAPGQRQPGEDLEKRQDQLLDQAIEETFPASDPISPKRITK